LQFHPRNRSFQETDRGCGRRKSRKNRTPIGLRIQTWGAFQKHRKNRKRTAPSEKQIEATTHCPALPYEFLGSNQKHSWLMHYTRQSGGLSESLTVKMKVFTRAKERSWVNVRGAEIWMRIDQERGRAPKHLGERTHPEPPPRGVKKSKKRLFKRAGRCKARAGLTWAEKTPPELGDHPTPLCEEGCLFPMGF